MKRARTACPHRLLRGKAASYRSISWGDSSGTRTRLRVLNLGPPTALDTLGTTSWHLDRVADLLFAGA